MVTRKFVGLISRAFAGFIFLLFVVTVCLFFPVWTFKYWQAWVFLASFFVPVLFITVYLTVKDPKLLERRVKAGPVAEKEKSQKIIQSIAQIAFLLVIIFPSVDHRFSWSSVPTAICLVGDIVVVLGLVIVFFVFRENSFTSATIETEKEQKVITTGPYALVRHPMYIGALLMLLGVPLALGSWWGILALIPITIVIILRLLDEENYLLRNLSGYKNYYAKVQYRLVPYIW